MQGTRPWCAAWAAAQRDAYAAAAPADLFGTSAQDPAALLPALRALALAADRRLGRPAPFHVVDLGAGDGRLLPALLDVLPSPLAHRVDAVALDRRPPPADHDPRVRWVVGDLPDMLAPTFPYGMVGLVLAFEWLDDLPCEVVEVDARGALRVVEVDERGREVLGAALPTGPDRAWLDRWWPVAAPGERAEVGRPRDAAWAAVVAATRGTAVAVDYGHLRGARSAGAYATGTLAAYRGGRSVLPVPDGRANLTAHVALDAVRAATGAPGLLRVQRHVLRAAAAPTPAPPGTNLIALAAASRTAAARAAPGRGAHAWLVQHPGCGLSTMAP